MKVAQASSGATYRSSRYTFPWILDIPPSIVTRPTDCRRRDGGVKRGTLRMARRKTLGGTAMPQHSLSSYFRVVHDVLVGEVRAADTAMPCLPVRRFNPACLMTLSGRSIITQILNAAIVMVIEDMDLEPDHLQTHRTQFGLSGTACVHLVRDGFRTEANHFVLGRTGLVESLPGERLW